jgi:hypothetical protein
MTDFRAPRRQPAETDYWWPEPESAHRSAWRGEPPAQDRRPALMQQRRQLPHPQEQPPGRGGDDSRSRQRALPPGPGGRSLAETGGGSYRAPSYPASAQADPARSQPVSSGGAKRLSAGGSGTSPAGSAGSAASLASAAARLRRPQSTALALAGTTPLTSFGVSAVLAGACILGGLLDLLLVSTAAWAITGLFLASSVYAAMKVHRSHWYSAVVGPPLAFAAGLLFVAQFSPERTGPGFMGTVTTILALLAIKARAAFAGTALGLGIVLARRLPFNR